jgi:hypothetical protein
MNLKDFRLKRVNATPDARPIRRLNTLWSRGAIVRG